MLYEEIFWLIIINVYLSNKMFNISLIIKSFASTSYYNFWVYWILLIFATPIL